MNRRTLLQSTAAIAAVAAFVPELVSTARAGSSLGYTEMGWGRINDNIPDLGEDPFADAASRAKYWLPEPPAANSAMWPFWQALKGKSLTNQDNQYLPVLANGRGPAGPGGSSPPFVVTAAPPDAASSESVALAAASGRWSRSENWSGTYLRSTGGNMFTQVVGQWSTPASVTYTPVPNGKYRSSIWIGIDGQARYTNATLPQIGTSQIFNKAGALVHRAWFEWWDNRIEEYHKKHAKLSSPNYIVNLPIDAGHVILCSLEVVQGDAAHPVMARMCIKNDTTGRFIMPFLVYAPPVGRDREEATVTGATAEWVVERPWSTADNALFTLPNYGSVAFSNCAAVLAPAIGLAGTPEGLLTAKYITMYEVQQQPVSRTINISQPSRAVQNAFTMTYLVP
jgi:hypothetical protein